MKKKKIVFKVQQSHRKCWSKALGILDAADGVISSIAWEGEDKIVVFGDEVDPAKLNAILKKKFGSAKIEVVTKEEKKKPTTQKIVFKVQPRGRILAAADGVISSIAWEGEDKIVVVGDEVDLAKLNDILKKKFGSAKIEEVIKEDTENLRKKYEEQMKKTADIRKKYDRKKKELVDMTKNYEDMTKNYNRKEKENEILRKKCEKVKR